MGDREDWFALVVLCCASSASVRRFAGLWILAECDGLSASAAAQKWVERGSCGLVGVVDPFEWGGGGVAVFDEVEHALHEIGA